MFQNGLLATFIPEILMVIAYVLCLFTPGFKSENTSVEQASIVIQTASFEHQSNSTYQLSAYDFQSIAEITSDYKSIVSPFSEKAVFNFYESPFSISDGLSFVDFSRPPPTFIV